VSLRDHRSTARASPVAARGDVVALAEGEGVIGLELKRVAVGGLGVVEAVYVDEDAAATGAGGRCCAAVETRV
jgi:hypothetical protein